ncbi:MAG: hypothetical protein M0R06_19025 [Sphaerochaeta sp.]|jgi:hypothetical protein|nr:hypothetical protein [Sphaerochaeta sp.]
MTTLEKKINDSITAAFQEAIGKVLTDSYHSPLKPMIVEVVDGRKQELKAIMSDVLGKLIATEQFKNDVADAFLHKVARTLVDQMDGSVKQAAEQMRQDPTIKAQMVLAIKGIIDSHAKPQV